MDPSPSIAEPATPANTTAATRFQQVRAATLALVRGLSPEDLAAQSMPDASPGKWHLAHTSWFFEVMLLGPHAGLAPLEPRWLPLLNSYYEALGSRHPRPERGLLTRPALEAVLHYRRAVDARVLAFLEDRATPAALAVLELGLQHEQQHQELMVTDLKHLFSRNPLQPAAWPPPHPPTTTNPCRSGVSRDPDVPGRGSRRSYGGAGALALGWFEHPAAGPVDIGADAAGFSFDNERPRHTAWLQPFALADRPVSCAEFLAFVEAGGYNQPQWWQSDGFAAARAGDWQAPLYWERREDGWWRFTAHGPQPLRDDEPVCHLSWYEAEAFARFAGARLPTEAEWEVVARAQGWPAPAAGTGRLEPAPMQGPTPASHVWEWTASAYAPYPGFHPLAGAASEYNGKFMSGQMVLRGGSCATPPGHARRTYRNFFPPQARWQFSGLRLARDLR